MVIRINIISLLILISSCINSEVKNLEQTNDISQIVIWERLNSVGDSLFTFVDTVFSESKIRLHGYREIILDSFIENNRISIKPFLLADSFQLGSFFICKKNNFIIDTVIRIYYFNTPTKSFDVTTYFYSLKYKLSIIKYYDHFDVLYKKILLNRRHNSKNESILVANFNNSILRRDFMQDSFIYLEINESDTPLKIR